ncbi:54S ribosomal protein L3 [Geranomyces variabilis]|uniref:Large ribosomal subunit protein uL3m n=1 Tax=Geranomyces variabilis TaxID=109894 RepID=A0AAD5TKF7_9FUNG|nr:54S ribosomal protein L3 [Geranomyces variabilis]
MSSRLQQPANLKQQQDPQLQQRQHHPGPRGFLFAPPRSASPATPASSPAPPPPAPPAPSPLAIPPLPRSSSLSPEQAFFSTSSSPSTQRTPPPTPPVSELQRAASSGKRIMNFLFRKGSSGSTKSSGTSSRKDKDLVDTAKVPSARHGSSPSLPSPTPPGSPTPDRAASNPDLGQALTFTNNNQPSSDGRSLRSVSSMSSLSSFAKAKKGGIFGFSKKKAKQLQEQPAALTIGTRPSSISAIALGAQAPLPLSQQQEALKMPRPPSPTPPPDSDGTTADSNTLPSPSPAPTPVQPPSPSPPQLLPAISSVSGSWGWNGSNESLGSSAPAAPTAPSAEPLPEKAAPSTTTRKNSVSAADSGSAGECASSTDAVRRKSTARSARSSRSNSSDSTTVIPDVLSPPVKPVVSIAGATIETDDPSHLFWVPAHLHPELHPSDFSRWIADSDENLAMSLASPSALPFGDTSAVFNVGKKQPLRRSKSFVERHIVITPENAEDFIEPDNVVRSRTVGGTPTTAARPANKGLPPLKRSRNIKPKRPTMGSTEEKGDESGRRTSAEQADNEIAEDDERQHRRKEPLKLDPETISAAVAGAGRRRSKKSIKKHRTGNRRSRALSGDKMDGDAGNGKSRPFSFVGIAPVELPKATSASGQDEDVSDDEDAAPALPSPVPAVQPGEKNVKEESGKAEGSVESGNTAPPASQATPAQVKPATAATVSPAGAGPGIIDPSSANTSAKASGKKKKDGGEKRWNWLSFLSKRSPTTTTVKHQRTSASSSSSPSPENGDDWNPYPPNSQQHARYAATNSSSSGSGSPSPLPGRLTLDDEKYVYRISHIKLAEHRRPLFQQVLISNLMLYILSVHADVTLNRMGGGPRKRGKRGKRPRKNSNAVGSSPTGPANGRVVVPGRVTHPLASPSAAIPVAAESAAASNSAGSGGNALMSPIQRPPSPQQQPHHPSQPLTLRNNNAHLAAIKSQIAPPRGPAPAPPQSPSPPPPALLSSPSATSSSSLGRKSPPGAPRPGSPIFLPSPHRPHHQHHHHRRDGGGSSSGSGSGSSSSNSSSSSSSSSDGEDATTANTGEDEDDVPLAARNSSAVKPFVAHPAALVARQGLPHLRPAPPATFPVSDGVGPTPTTEWKPDSKRTGIVGIKKGMTAVWDEWGVLTPVTVLQIVDCEVIRTRWHAGCGSYIVEVGSVDHPRLHRINKAQLFHYRRWTVAPKRKMTGFRVSPDACLPTGTRLLAAHFVPGQFVDCQATSTAKGFQGAMKRWGFSGQKATHGTSLAHRSLGSTGQIDPGRVWKGKKMAGNMGNDTITVQNLRVMKIDTENNLVYVKGAVPGTDERFVRIKDAVRKGWHGKTFPAGTTVPFPTFLGDPAELPRELLPAPPKEAERDPFSRQRREREV